MGYELSFRPVEGPGTHDASAALFRDGTLVHGVEEERFTREKHAPWAFPTNAITSCLDSRGLDLPDLDGIVIPYDPDLYAKRFPGKVRRAASAGPLPERLWHVVRTSKETYVQKYRTLDRIESRLAEEFATPVPPLRTRSHHACHVASAYHPSPFDSALGLTVDGAGEYDSTVVWNCTPGGLERVRTYETPNSLGKFYSAVTEFLGFRPLNGEGKVMGLAPYGSENPEIDAKLREAVEVGVDYDVTRVTAGGYDRGVERLEAILGRERSDDTGSFSDWEKDLAYTAQRIVEETVVDLVDHYRDRVGTGDVVLAGGVALNCKLNQQIAALDGVDLFVQPVANDAGLAVGAGFVDRPPGSVEEMADVYWGPEYDRSTIESTLETNRVPYAEPPDLEREVAERIADGEIVGWFQGKLEMGPRALGNRSILADPRTEASRDRVNRYVKHREEWRPFAPSVLADAAERYLKDPENAPYMIQTFDTKPETRTEIAAVVHPADGTTRPQTVREDRNPRYYRLLSEFEVLTGVPVLLNTSFNDHGEPIVNRPREALKDFYGMGLDALVLGDFLVEKEPGGSGREPA